MPDEPEATGLLALMVLTDARRPARTDPNGAMIRLAEQDRSLWDRRLIARRSRPRLRLLAPQPVRPFQIQAAIAAAHADAAAPADTDWAQIFALCDQLHTSAQTRSWASTAPTLRPDNRRSARIGTPTTRRAVHQYSS